MSGTAVILQVLEMLDGWRVRWEGRRSQRSDREWTLASRWFFLTSGFLQTCSFICEGELKKALCYSHRV